MQHFLLFSNFCRKELSSEMDIARREFAEKERNWSAEVRERDLKLREAQSKLQTLKEEKMRNEDERGHLLEEVSRKCLKTVKL